MRIAVVGAGIGGLTLAQGLTRVGVAVDVYERDPAPDFRDQGYRVTLRPSGMESLSRCLPPEHIESILDASRPWTGMSVMDEKLRVLMTLRNPSEPMRSIDRLTLRQVLLRGVQERVHFNRVFTGYNQHSDHVTLHFSDGSTVDADVLVGADGNQSRVRSLLLPEHAELRDTGYRDLAGKVRLTAEARHLMAALKIASISMVTTVDGPTMVLIPQEFADSSQDYLYWGLVAKRDRYAELGKPDPTEPEHLRKTALNITSTWDERFRQLIGLTPAGALKLLVFRSSVPHGPWVSGRVTLLGDAVHSMVPMRGEGANTAVRDASALADSLAAAGGREVVQAAVAPYEREMLIYGFGKVRESLSSLELFVGGSRSKRIVLRTVLRSVQRGRTLFRRTASSSRALH